VREKERAVREKRERERERAEERKERNSIEDTEEEGEKEEAEKEEAVERLVCNCGDDIFFSYETALTYSCQLPSSFQNSWDSSIAENASFVGSITSNAQACKAQQEEDKPPQTPNTA